MNRTVWMLTAACVLSTTAALQTVAHCQIPCGIYGDTLRFELLTEHITTLEKSIREIARLSAEDTPNWNQLVRWVQNKEHHADQFTEIVTAYFMAQRIKPASPEDAAAYAKYVRELTLLHRMMVEAMKAKQSTDLAHCAKLRDLVDSFRASYMDVTTDEAPHKH